MTEEKPSLAVGTEVIASTSSRPEVYGVITAKNFSKDWDMWMYRVKYNYFGTVYEQAIREINVRSKTKAILNLM